MQALEDGVAAKYKASKSSKARSYDTVKPVSDRPEDKGLFVVTSYDEFFKIDLEKNKNATGSSK